MFMCGVCVCVCGVVWCVRSLVFEASDILADHGWCVDFVFLLLVLWLTCEREREGGREMNIDQEVEIPVTTVETVITTTADDVPIMETTLEEVYYYGA